MTHSTTESAVGASPAPNVSHSITVRLEVPAGGTAVGHLTTTVEQSGGVVTALDVAAVG